MLGKAGGPKTSTTSSNRGLRHVVDRSVSFPGTSPRWVILTGPAPGACSVGKGSVRSAPSSPCGTHRGGTPKISKSAPRPRVLGRDQSGASAIATFGPRAGAIAAADLRPDRSPQSRVVERHSRPVRRRGRAHSDRQPNLFLARRARRGALYRPLRPRQPLSRQLRFAREPCRSGSGHAQRGGAAIRSPVHRRARERHPEAGSDSGAGRGSDRSRSARAVGRAAAQHRAGANEVVPGETTSAEVPDLPLPADEPAVVSSFTVQVTTPDGPSVDAALAAVRGAPGIRGVATSSIAIGGTSVMRVTFAGDLADLAEALRARGWQVDQGSNALAISR